MTTINSEKLESFNLLIIDPQNDFTLEDGGLSVPGAIADARRLVKFMQEKKDSVNKIFVSLDTHTEKHIGHQKFWKKVNKSGEDIKDDKSGLAIHPDFYTIFDTSPTLQKIQDKNGELYSPVNDSLYDYARDYIKSFATKDAEGNNVPNEKGVPLIWPTHCIEGTWGHKIYEPLESLLLKDDFSGKTSYYIKGQNELVEMYSIFKGEYNNTDNKTSYEGDMKANNSIDGKFDYVTLYQNTEINKLPEKEKLKSMAPYLNTQFNRNGLFNELTKDGSPIYIAGEALSHCVNWSLRDLVNNIKTEKLDNYVDDEGKIISNKIFLIKNASSAIGGFEDNVTNLLAFCESNNVQPVDIDEAAASITGGNRRRTRKSGKKRKNKSYKKNRRSRGKKSRK